MKRPLLWTVIVFCLGIIIAQKQNVDFLPAYLLTLAFLLLSLAFFNKSPAFGLILLVLVFLLGVCVLKNSYTLPRCHISKIINKPGSLYFLKGTIISQPRINNNRREFILEARELGMNDLKYSCCGKVLVYSHGAQGLDHGDELILWGKLYRPFVNHRQAKAGFRGYLFRQGILVLFSAKAVVKSGVGRLSLSSLACSFKKKIEAIISEYTPPPASGVLEAMLLGEKKNIPPLVYDSMIKTGTVHILVVSGFNVSLAVFVIMLALKLARVPCQARFLLAAPLLIFYCLVTGASTPVMRATVMALFSMFAYFFRRQADIFNACALAAIFILIINPNQLFDIGFQLSFTSVIAIVYLYPKIKRFLGTEKLKASFLKHLSEGFLVSFSAWLGTAGFIAYYFKVFSPVTVLANIFIVPLASLITFCGFGLVFLGWIFPCAALPFARAAGFLVALLLKLNALLLRLPGAYLYLS